MTEVKNLKQVFLNQAKRQRRKIGIGIIHPESEIIESIKRGSEFADIVIVGTELNGFDCFATKDDQEGSRVLVQLLKDKRIDGLVRGQLKDSVTLNTFMEVFNKQIPHNRKQCPVVLENSDGTVSTVLVSGSIYHGHFLEDKIYEAERTIKYMENFGIRPKIGIMSMSSTN